MELGGWGCKEDLGEAGIGENVIRLYSMKNTFSIINKILKSNCLDHSEILKQKKLNPMLMEWENQYCANGFYYPNWSTYSIQFPYSPS